MNPLEFSRLRAYWTASHHKPTWKGTSRRTAKSQRHTIQTKDQRKLAFNKPIMQNNIKILSFKKSIIQKNDGSWYAK